MDILDTWTSAGSVASGATVVEFEPTATQRKIRILWIGK